jgi:hypothetical protein
MNISNSTDIAHRDEHHHSDPRSSSEVSGRVYKRVDSREMPSEHITVRIYRIAKQIVEGKYKDKVLSRSDYECFLRVNKMNKDRLSEVLTKPETMKASVYSERLKFIKQNWSQMLLVRPPTGAPGREGTGSIRTAPISRRGEEELEPHQQAASIVAKSVASSRESVPIASIDLQEDPEPLTPSSPMKFDGSSSPLSSVASSVSISPQPTLRASSAEISRASPSTDWMFARFGGKILGEDLFKVVSPPVKAKESTANPEPLPPDAEKPKDQASLEGPPSLISTSLSDAAPEPIETARLTETQEAPEALSPDSRKDPEPFPETERRFESELAMKRVEKMPADVLMHAPTIPKEPDAKGGRLNLTSSQARLPSAPLSSKEPLPASKKRGISEDFAPVPPPILGVVASTSEPVKPRLVPYKVSEEPIEESIVRTGPSLEPGVSVTREGKLKDVNVFDTTRPVEPNPIPKETEKSSETVAEVKNLADLEQSEPSPTTLSESFKVFGGGSVLPLTRKSCDFGMSLGTGEADDTKMSTVEASRAMASFNAKYGSQGDYDNLLSVLSTIWLPSITKAGVDIGNSEAHRSLAYLKLLACEQPEVAKELLDKLKATDPSDKMFWYCFQFSLLKTFHEFATMHAEAHPELNPLLTALESAPFDISKDSYKLPDVFRSNIGEDHSTLQSTTISKTAIQDHLAHVIEGIDLTAILDDPATFRSLWNQNNQRIFQI